MESLAAPLLESLLHPMVLLAAAVSTVLLFSGAVGWALDAVAGHRHPARRAVRAPRLGVTGRPAGKWRIPTLAPHPGRLARQPAVSDVGSRRLAF